ncbi:MAG: hypothetical protein GXY83_16935 [Rhodopirellula sp.]|nr:hypothetical protein [Rhodopirellula sp.]
MSKKTIELVDVFEVFWDHIRRAEQDVRRNGHLGRLPPDCSNDPWDADFAAAYEAVKRYLRKFRRDRFFPVPAGLAFRSGPIQAESAHQALMYFLNKPDELHGEVGVLDSTEYVAIKAEAIKELELRDKARRPRLKTDAPVSSQDARMLASLTMLQAFVMEHHFPAGGNVVCEPLTLKQIVAKFGWSQSTATRRMKKLFPRKEKGDPEGMAAYNKLFAGEAPTRGYLQAFKDGTLDVEAIWRDRASRQDDEDRE